jgi:DNA replication protein DnaC
MVDFDAMKPAAAPPPPVRCASCEDRGWIVRPGDDGVERASPCDCAKRRGLDLSISSARIPERYRHCTIQNFSPLNASLRRAREAADELANDWPQVQAGLLFCGPCGSGKTHLAVGLLQALIRRHQVSGLYVDCALLIREIQDAFGSDDRSRRDLIRPVEETEVVLLDDLGGTKPSEWVRDTIAGIVNSRYNASRLTLVTTRFADEPANAVELTLEQQVGVAVRSRLYEMCTTWRLETDDFRRRVRNASH